MKTYFSASRTHRDKRDLAGRCGADRKCRVSVAVARLLSMARYTTFSYCLDPTVEQQMMLARYAGGLSHRGRCRLIPAASGFGASSNRAVSTPSAVAATRNVRNIRAHFLHQVSNALVKTHDGLVIEDLNVSGMIANRRLARSIGDRRLSRIHANTELQAGMARRRDRVGRPLVPG